jgi:hypothetical protein
MSAYFNSRGYRTLAVHSGSDVNRASAIESLKKGDVVIYESTVYPGCTEEVCVPVLEKHSGFKFNEDFYCGYSPERINPGDKVNTLTKIKKITSGSTPEVADAAIKEINETSPDFICLNFANADMVGHTGVWDAVVKAVETVDSCVEKVVAASLKKDYTVFLTADHGNADYEINEDGTPYTAHTTNPVPFFIIDKYWNGKIKPGKLGDISPTILKMMDLPIPAEMKGNILID